MTVGVRPEHLRLATEADGPRRIEIAVDLIEALGADTVVHGHVAGSGETLLARLPGSHQVAAGDRLPLAVEPGCLHLFDPSSTRSLTA